jgi:hypothetical protein
MVDKLKVVEQYSWYIMTALQFKIEMDQKALDKAKESMKSDDGSDPYRSLEGMIEHVEWSLKDYKKAFNALKDIGLK